MTEAEILAYLITLQDEHEMAEAYYFHTSGTLDLDNKETLGIMNIGALSIINDLLKRMNGDATADG